MGMSLWTLLGSIALIASTYALPYSEVPRKLEKREADFDGVSSEVFVAPVQLGCAAALVCVEDRFCTLDGTISPEPVVLTSKQLLRRVPLSSCKNPDNGVIGKCCRDPNYVDPWPTGNLPANYTGGFDEQGFPTFLNIARVKPPKKPIRPPTTTPSPIIFEIPEQSIPDQTIVQIPQIPQEIPQQVTKTVDEEAIEYVPEQVPQILEFPQNPERVHEIQQIEQIPDIPQIPLIPQIPDTSNLSPQTIPYPQPIPNVPLVPRPFSKNVYDVASSNENPALLPPINQCGIRNNVPHPEGLRNPEAAFAEIPWQAMVLLNPTRKILCSGAIIEPMVVLTAASCVDGLGSNDVAIKSGEWKLGYELKHEEPLPYEIVGVSSILIHPNYLRGSPSNDTAMLILSHPVHLDAHVNPVCLPSNLHFQETRDCIVTGWGKQILQVNVAGAIMHSLDVDLLPPHSCEERLNGAESHLDVDHDMICVKAHRQNNNMCQADLGSPLACRNENGIYEIMGIYSQDTGCVPTNQVAAFSHIDTTWLKTTLSNPVPEEIPEDIEPASQQDNYEYRKSNLPPEANQYLPPEAKQYLPPV